MARRRTPRETLAKRALIRARELAEEVNQTAERVHQHAREAHRLTEIARREAERGRELSRAGRMEARAVANSIKSSVDVTNNGGARRATKNDD